MMSPLEGSAALEVAAALAFASLSRLFANHSRITMTDSSDLGSNVRRLVPIPNVLSSATTSSWDPEQGRKDREERRVSRAKAFL